MNPASIAFDFTEDDWIAFHMYHYAPTQQVKKWRQVTSLLVPGILIAAMLFAAYREVLTRDLFVLAVLCIAAWIWCMITIMSKKKQEARFRRLMKGDNSSITGRHTWTAEEDGLRFVQPTAEGIMQWQGFKKLGETNDHYFLYHTAVSAIIIPRARVAGDVEAFMAIVRQQVKG